MRMSLVFCLLLGSLVAERSATGQDVSSPAILKLTGDWQVHVALPAAGSARPITATVDVAPAVTVEVRAEKHRLPLYNPKTGGWARGAKLRGIVAQECTNRGLLDPASLQIRTAPGPDAPRLELGKDFAADLEWGTLGRLPNGPIGENQPVYVDYRHGLSRIDSIVLTRQQQIVLRQGRTHAAAPLPPALEEGERRLANVWIPGGTAKLTADHLFPILETAYPEPAKQSPTPAERLLPKTMQKLRQGQKLRVLAWGDSVTVGTFVPDPERNRWQEQFVARLRERFPQAKIELVTEAWGGRNTGTYLAEPPGSPHNYREKVLAARPDLVVSEFVNDAGLNQAQVDERYGKLLADFRKIGAEWIILTPHYTRPDMMRLTREREIDEDPRPYVAALRQFAPKHQVALADASLRWGRLWRQGIPYRSLLLNAINHPDARGMRLFADSLMQLFP